jgi:hypothetical protein
MTTRTRTTALALTTAATLCGCAIPNPAAPATPAPTTPGEPVAKAPTGLRIPAAVVRAQRDPLVGAAVRYVLTQATWSADTYVSQQASLADMSTGRALSQLQPRDGQPPAAVAATLAAAGASSQAVLIGTDGPSRGYRVVVAYKTHATGRHRNPNRADYQIAHVTLTRRHNRWLVSDFAIAP